MSEEMIPDTVVVSDVAESVVPSVNYSEKSLAELSKIYEDFMMDEDRIKKYKEAEAIRSAFYKKLSKEKYEAGYGILTTPLDDDSVGAEVLVEAVETKPVEVDANEVAPSDGEISNINPFEEIENSFKYLYAKYKKERSEYNKIIDKEKEINLKLKEAVIEDLKLLVDKQEDINLTFPAFRDIQNRWREIGLVPIQNVRDINNTYQLYVEQFYDKVKISHELRDLDFKKNLEAKEEFCVIAEKLAEQTNVVEAFQELQKLHEQWKEYGPVDKAHREEIWDRFKAATAVINKKYQEYYEVIKVKHTENLDAKTLLCEEVELIAQKEVINSNQWNEFSKEIEEIQKKWKSIGFASKKDNQKIYDRFRVACDKFFERKREFYNEYKDSINDNLVKKIALCETAESLKTSTDWKKTSDLFINLQKQWKEIGAVPRKKSDQLWKRFRAACDEFFNERDKQAKPENDFYGNLKAKQRLIEEISNYELNDDENENRNALVGFQKSWQEIGFVPFKEKDNIAAAYKAAIQSKFPNLSTRVRKTQYSRPALSDKERLVQKYVKLEQSIVTYENNIGFFAMSKNSEPLIKQFQDKIEAAKKELKEIKDEIQSLDDSKKEVVNN